MADIKKLGTQIGTTSIVTIAGLAMLASSAVALAQEQDAEQTVSNTGAASPVVAQGHVVSSNAIKSSKVEGIFSFSQTEVDSNSLINSTFADANKYLCSSQYASMVANGDIDVDSLEWSITVGGDVAHPFTATISEMSDEGSVQNIMGCTCLGNPVDGRASINARVKGISLDYIMDTAGVSESANTVVFTSSDGYEIALPLSYVKYRFSILAYEINGESMGDVLGCNNQLWLGSTSANYFTRDVISITFETRQTPPPTPFTEEGNEYYGNLPNISVRAAD